MKLVAFLYQLKLLAAEHPGCIAVDFEFGRDGAVMLTFRRTA